ncbi:MAG: phosphatase PAP2 family protein [Vicingaceae bacterium]
MLELLEKWDRQIFLLINGWHNELFDQIMWHISGKFEWIPLYLILLWLLIKNYGKSVWKILIGVIAVIVLTDQLSVHLFKNIFERYRPCHNLEISELVHSVNNKCGGRFGFVSSHAANTFGLATFIGLFLSNSNKNIAFVLLLLWASIVSYSRIYLGVHYPLDVLGGAILGMLIAYLIYFLITKLFSIQNLKYG